MKILHLISSIDRGGAENNLTTLVKEQISYGHSVSIGFLKGTGYWRKYFNSIGAKVSLLRPEKKFLFLSSYFEFFFAIINARSLIKKLNPEIINAHLPAAELISRFALLGTNKQCKFIITKHVDNVFFKGSEGQNKSLLGAIIVRWIVKRSNKVIAISEAVKKFLISDYVKLNSEKIKVVHYGIDVNNFLSNDKNVKELKDRLQIDNQCLVVGTIARLVKQKSLDILIKAFADFKKNNNFKSKLIIVGNGPLENELKKLSQALKIEKDVIWLGFRDDIPTILKIFDIFCLCSKYEGLGLVLLEAMASGLPILATKVSAMPEIVKNNVNGLLVSPNSLSELSEGINKLKDASLRNRLGEEGKKIVSEKFSTSKMFNETEAIYNS